MSEFSGEGFQSFPSLYQDNQQTHLLSTWERPVLEERLTQYLNFTRQEDLMPRAREQANRFLSHLIFELGYLDGVYDGIQS